MDALDSPGDDEPIRLSDACKIFFRGRIGPSALRTEAKKGRLVIERIAGKDFVTPRAIREMRGRCRLPASNSAEPLTPTDADKACPDAGGAPGENPPISAHDALNALKAAQGKAARSTAPERTGRLEGALLPLRPPDEL